MTAGPANGSNERSPRRRPANTSLPASKARSVSVAATAAPLRSVLLIIVHLQGGNRAVARVGLALSRRSFDLMPKAWRPAPWLARKRGQDFRLILGELRDRRRVHVEGCGNHRGRGVRQPVGQ